ncbi:D-lactate dehydrogenase [Pseudochrobactrum sp. MP213Fo]|uniref:D-lactate dehydrogenase n=1 Tax=Pseudochrobactrum sp. MP213Fo TaxID=3022250 RepID=UPI003B9F37C2
MQEKKQLIAVPQKLIIALRAVVGKKHILTSSRATERYRKGFRSGEGEATAVVFPARLIELWRTLQACVDHNAIIIVQASNTGLTEGSTPSGYDYDRPVVIISTLRMDRIDVINDGRQVISLPGATLFKLEKLLKPWNRQPHSVIGSSCIGASIIGGISNNSGGALIKRGPAYTELALYAQLNEHGILHLVNDLGIDLGSTPEEILSRLDKGDYTPDDIKNDSSAIAHDNEYAARVRKIEEKSPARFNADPRRLKNASGCAGKLAVFAVRLDTFAPEGEEQTFYIGTNDTKVLTEIRRHILQDFKDLPVAGEYMHRVAFAVTRIYGKDTFVMIEKFGTEFMPRFFNLKGRIDSFTKRLPFLPSALTDRIMQKLMHFLPEVLPQRLLQFHDKYEHHLMLKMSGSGVKEAQEYLSALFRTPENEENGSWFTCTAEEGRKAFLHRFAAAGAAIRYAIIHDSQTEDMVALDIALPRNTQDWYELLPENLDKQCLLKLYYGHFFCHVFHQDYVVAKGCNVTRFKHDLLAQLSSRGAEYPAEHNVGHVYQAKPEQAVFYQQLDPTNSFNPGIGKASKFKFYGCKCDDC